MTLGLEGLGQASVRSVYMPVRPRPLGNDEQLERGYHINEIIFSLSGGLER